MNAYLWQQANWPDTLRWSAAELLSVVADVRRAQGHLLGRATGLGMDLGRGLHAESLALDAVGTAGIEGEQLDPEGVRSSVARHLGLPLAAHRSPSRAVDGLVQVLVDATANHDKPLDTQRLHGWHAALFPTGYSGIRRLTVGAWRPGPEPMRVVSGGLGGERVHFVAPPAETLDDEMARFLRWFNTPPAGLDGLIRAGLAHLWFVTVHPYDDGNGRLTRALTDMALAQDERSPLRLYSMSAQIERCRPAYYDAIELAQHGDGDVTPWLSWFLDTLRLAMEDAELRMDAVLARARFWRDRGAVPMSERQAKVVKRLLEAGPGGFQGGLTTRKYAALTGASKATAQREIADLVAKSVLIMLDARGRSTAYELAW